MQTKIRKPLSEVSKMPSELPDTFAEGSKMLSELPETFAEGSKMLLELPETLIKGLKCKKYKFMYNFNLKTGGLLWR